LGDDDKYPPVGSFRDIAPYGLATLYEMVVVVVNNVVIPNWNVVDSSFALFFFNKYLSLQLD
jgi:hypothetical protein